MGRHKIPPEEYLKQHNITGKQYGDLIVLEVRCDPTQTNNRSIIATCHCKCGTEIELTYLQLEYQHMAACRACTRKHRLEGTSAQRRSIWWDYWTQVRRGARDRGITFSITEHDLSETYSTECALTGLPITIGELQIVEGRAVRVNTTASLDRIDSQQGYIRSNIQWVHKDVNAMKSDYSTEYFQHLCELVASRRQANFIRRESLL